jgi:hypothetical protein
LPYTAIFICAIDLKPPSFHFLLYLKFMVDEIVTIGQENFPRVFLFLGTIVRAKAAGADFPAAIQVKKEPPRGEVLLSSNCMQLHARTATAMRAASIACSPPVEWSLPNPSPIAFDLEVFFAFRASEMEINHNLPPAYH